MKSTLKDVGINPVLMIGYVDSNTIVGIVCQSIQKIVRSQTHKLAYKEKIDIHIIISMFMSGYVKHYQDGGEDRREVIVNFIGVYLLGKFQRLILLVSKPTTFFVGLIHASVSVGHTTKLRYLI